MQIGALTAFLELPDADPDVGHDGDLHADDGAAGGGLRRADRGGARHRVLGGPAAASGHRAAAPRRAGAARRRVPATRAPPQPVLRDISFTGRRPGTTTAIIGSTGAGKTTLLSLIPRLFDATAGAVLVDGVDVRELRRRTCCGAGSGWCRRGRTCSPARSPATCATATRTPPTRSCGARWRSPRPRDFVAAMPGGLEAPIAQGGTNVSGGQRQRLAIARALVQRPEIYLFDDSFSALDLATDARLRAALRPVTARRRRGHRGPAGVDHRRRRPDRRARGRAASSASARHDELLDTCPTYAEIVASQQHRRRRPHERA